MRIMLCQPAGSSSACNHNDRVRLIYAADYMTACSTTCGRWKVASILASRAALSRDLSLFEETTCGKRFFVEQQKNHRTASAGTCVNEDRLSTVFNLVENFVITAVTSVG